MGLTRNGATVRCEQCKFVPSGDDGAFDLTVPISAPEHGMAGTARLHCVISPQCHHVELVEWNDAERGPTELSAEIRQCLADAISFIAEQRICGHPGLCPSEITRLVAARGQRRAVTTETK